MNFANEDNLKLFFNNFKERNLLLIKNHLKEKEEYRVTDEEIDFLKTNNFVGKNITSIAGSIGELAFKVVKILYIKKDLINILLTPANQPVTINGKQLRGLGLTPQNLSSILNISGAKAGEVLNELGLVK